MDKDVVKHKRWLALRSSLLKEFNLDGVGFAGSVVLPLGLATGCTLDNSSGGLKGRGERYETRHSGRVSIEDDYSNSNVQY